jgi:hypothetical protein
MSGPTLVVHMTQQTDVIDAEYSSTPVVTKQDAELISSPRDAVVAASVTPSPSTNVSSLPITPSNSGAEEPVIAVLEPEEQHETAITSGDIFTET